MKRKTKARSASKLLRETRSLLFPFGIRPSALSCTFCLERRFLFAFFVPVRSFVGSFLSPSSVGFAQTRVSSSTWPFIKLSKRKTAFEKNLNKPCPCQNNPRPETKKFPRGFSAVHHLRPPLFQPTEGVGRGQRSH